MKALVLSGGGARGAYQVGVIKAIGEIVKELHIENPFHFLSGVSAGAINASFMASESHQFSEGTNKLVKLWSGLNSQAVFKTDVLSIGKIGLSWMGELSLGGAMDPLSGRSLLNTEPLFELIKNNLNLTSIRKNIENGHIKALSISALDYHTSETVTFVQGDPDLPNWKKLRRRSEKTMIKPQHVLASASIPFLFPSTQVGERHFGDGCVRNLAPLGPALYMGAEQLLVIGVRMPGELTDEDLKFPLKIPSISKVVNVILNTILLDGIETDVERLNRINEFLRRVPEQHQKNLNFRPVQALMISPSRDIGKLAGQMSTQLPRVIRYLLKGLGPLDEASELISYLLFEKDFLSSLIEMGYEDGLAQKEAISRFLLESQPQSLDWEGF
jgi:NTE family protein